MQANRSIHILKEISIVQANNLKSSKKVSFYQVFKRMMDLFIASIGIVITLPLILLFAILIRIDSPGSPFYVQQRVGKNGKCFRLIKLRSMRMDAEKDGEKWAEINDPRITKIGAFIRKTRIDELPQLFSVLKGDMSIIGPRPERPSFTEQFSKEIDGFSNRLLVKPGLTGLAQVNGGYDITPREKLTYDLQYINNVTFSLEMKILVKTIKVVLTGEGAR
ncbi:TuaA [Niallia circulans]|jgi:exopolysaccharide biosynthesis polyprenyl glycosylphosphotransferase|uniref:UDP-phosphate N-acetylgalactosaminyl-1-phosphate transferase n=1 Tax=Niallia circulans TaxID=1397 RepID=A0A0J1I973_NIACI|nr:exopolysaccharide biosynthesis polyprenyl glycosylphosphotransferase [Niallia circulans]KLV22519.1 UDP-phosphate N-acetylgalactosaminyl-1-phosphate transferase [Niallia circulans]MDR4318355.1 sugar transferase [Niallia circulans]MED3840408.1 exopolysaccharide biosynthesis polyprenyl glycosylphosphotransferase [Niallia circulans]MED4243257.1 exopolysaccharide biosynthesis polyprenyl glycosylphosphotransferase [Niallia circulans]MED4250020.1 exopolysaccharide biosynthesis polyprenyl glycosylp